MEEARENASRMDKQSYNERDAEQVVARLPCAPTDVNVASVAPQ